MAGENEEVVGEPVGVDHRQRIDRLGSSASAVIRRSARRTTVRARCRAAAARPPPGKHEGFERLQALVKRVDLALQPVDLGLGDT